MRHQGVSADHKLFWCTVHAVSEPGGLTVISFISTITMSLAATSIIERGTISVYFHNYTTYMKQPKRRQQAADTTIDFVKVARLDTAGAETAEIL